MECLSQSETYVQWLVDEGENGPLLSQSEKERITCVSNSMMMMGTTGGACLGRNFPRNRYVYPTDSAVGLGLSGGVTGYYLGGWRARERILREKEANLLEKEANGETQAYQASEWMKKVVEIGHRHHPDLRLFRVSTQNDRAILWPMAFFKGQVCVSGYQHEKVVEHGANFNGTDWVPCIKLGMEITGAYLEIINTAISDVPQEGEAVTKRLTDLRSWMIRFRKEMLICSANRLKERGFVDAITHPLLAEALKVQELRQNAKFNVTDELNFEELVSSVELREDMSLAEYRDEACIHHNWQQPYTDHFTYRQADHEDQAVTITIDQSYFPNKAFNVKE